MGMGRNGLWAEAPAYAGGGAVPAENYGSDMGSGFNPAGMYGGGIEAAGHQVWSAFPGIAQGIWGHSGRPYQRAGEAFKPYYEEATRTQNPFYEAGKTALPQFQNWLSKMQNPADFINNFMSSYQQSPWAKYQQQQAIRSATNLGSATGLSGSTPMMQQIEQNASNISSEDMERWLSHVLGVNSQYGAGEQNLINGGAHSADILSQLGQNAGEYMGGVNYGREAGKERDRNALISGIAKLFGG